MTLRMYPDEALSAAFRKNWWLALKVPLAGYLGWSFFLPQLWKVGVLVTTLLVSAFTVGSPIGQDVSNFHLYFMLGSMAAIVFGVFWYTIYVFAYLGRPGIASRAVGITGVLIFPILVLAVALLVGGLGALWGVPQEAFWSYLDRWTPVEAWRTIQMRPTADLDVAVRGERSTELWQTLDGNVKYVECLRHKVTVMRQRVGVVKGPADLVGYYPNWLHELGDCAHLYKPDPKRSERLQEALATQMAKVLGQETSSYLTMQRLYALDPASRSAGGADWIDGWRAVALIGVAGTIEVLEDSK